MERNPNCNGICARYELLFDNLATRRSNLDNAGQSLARARETLGRTTESINEVDAGIRFRAIEHFLEAGVEPSEEIIDGIDSKVDRTSLTQAADGVNTHAAELDRLEAKVASSQRVVDIRETALQACPGPNTSNVSRFLARVGLVDGRSDGCQFSISRGLSQSD